MPEKIPERMIIELAHECISSAPYGALEIDNSNRIIVLDLLKTIAHMEGSGFKYHHKALSKGYISRKIKGTLSFYAGRFGAGFALELPCKNGTQYHAIQYYLFKTNEKEREQIEYD